ncbi:MAG: hypothetical protein GXO75_16960 [Calditrichaeota bacterium]|nr:hypothetical protein [Calditrichota bacterium]
MTSMPTFSNFSLKNYESLHWIFLLSVLIFLLALSSFHQIGAYNVETDFYGSYAPNVHKMLHGGKYYDEDHGPGYIFPLIILYLIIGDVFVAGKILTIISTVLFLLFTFLAIKSLFNSRYAFYTSLLLFVLLIPYSVLASTDMFFAFVVSLSVYLIFRKGDFCFKNMFWGGIVAGYAFMTRLNGTIIPLAIIFSLIFINSPQWSWRDKLKATGIFLLAMLIGSMPWYIMNLIYYGKFFVSGAHETLGASLLAGKSAQSANFAWGAEKEKIARQYHSLFALIFQNFPLIAKTVIANIPLYFRSLLSYLVGYPGFLFVAPGLLILLARANKAQLSFLTIPLFGFLIYSIVSFITRFYIYILGYVALFVVYFLFDNLLFRYSQSTQKKFFYLSRIIFIIILLFSLQKSKFLISKTIANEPRYIKKVAEILKENSNEDDLILARKPHLGYFSERKTELFPDVKNIKDLLEYVRAHNIRFVYYGIVESELRPSLSELKHPEELPSDFQLIYGSKTAKVFLYRIMR